MPDANNMYVPHVIAWKVCKRQRCWQHHGSKHCSTGVSGDSVFHIRNRRRLEQSQRRTIAMNMDCTENMMVLVYSALSVLYI